MTSVVSLTSISSEVETFAVIICFADLFNRYRLCMSKCFQIFPLLPSIVYLIAALYLSEPHLLKHCEADIKDSGWWLRTHADEWIRLLGAVSTDWIQYALQQRLELYPNFNHLSKEFIITMISYLQLNHSAFAVCWNRTKATIKPLESSLSPNWKISTHVF